MATISDIMTVPWASIGYVGPVVSTSVASVAVGGGGGITPPSPSQSWVLHTGQSTTTHGVAFYDAANSCIWQFRPYNRTLYKIDPATDNILTSVVLHSGAYLMTDMTDSYLYFSNGDVYKFRVNKSTLAESPQAYIDWYGGNQVEVGSYVWTGCLGGSGTIKRIDYSTGATAAVSGTGTGNGMGVYDGQYLWFGTNYRSYRTIYKINPATNTVAASFTLSYSMGAGFYHNGYVYFFGGWSSAANGSWPYNGCCKINVSTHAITYIAAPSSPYDTIGRDQSGSMGVMKDSGGNAYYQMLTSSTGKSGIVKFDPSTETWSMVYETTPTPNTNEQVCAMYPPDLYISRYDTGNTRPGGYYKWQ